MMQKIKYAKAGRLALMALASALLLPLAQGQSPARPGSGSMQSGMAGSSSMSGGGMDTKAMMKDMNEKMSSMQMSGNPDIDFAMTMRVHHQGAIDMAEAELRDGKEPQMRKMAKEIIAAQKNEIAQFDSLLAKHGHTVNKMSK